jgi:flavin reductase (DIM6/NTAB) family NADH-FMN oxidoreductase RutF
MPVDSRSFRKALGCFATGVTVVTTLDPDTAAPVGVTVSAFSSLSLEPPLVLFCLGNRTTNLDSYRRSSHFAVNVLSELQRDLSLRFASKAENKWTGIVAETWDSGVPILPGCLANLECAVTSVQDGGDHTIFVGRIERLRHQEGGSPLIYFRGSYLEPPVCLGGEAKK